MQINHKANESTKLSSKIKIKKLSGQSMSNCFIISRGFKATLKKDDRELF